MSTRLNQLLSKMQLRISLRRHPSLRRLKQTWSWNWVSVKFLLKTIKTKFRLQLGKTQVAWLPRQLFTSKIRIRTSEVKLAICRRNLWKLTSTSTISRSAVPCNQLCQICSKQSTTHKLRLWTKNSEPLIMSRALFKSRIRDRIQDWKVKRKNLSLRPALTF